MLDEKYTLHIKNMCLFWSVKDYESHKLKKLNLRVIWLMFSYLLSFISQIIMLGQLLLWACIYVETECNPCFCPSL